MAGALAESKKDRRVVNGWSKPKILALLSRMHRRREELGYGKVRREVPALVSAAEAYFGSWGRLLIRRASIRISILCVTSGEN